MIEVPKSGWLARILSALLGPFLAQLDKGSLPKYEGTLSLPGLENKVEVFWDSCAIPHVFADNEHDLFFAQGYLHAQERLWQMDMSRRFLSGRLAESFGKFSVPWKELSTQFRRRTSADFDFFIRLLGVRQAAVACLEVLPESDIRRLEAYSDGVNRYVDSCKRLPWEFRLLRYQPEPWRPEDSLTVSKGFAFLLSPALFTRLNQMALAIKLRDQPERLRSLFPTYPEDGPTITAALRDSTKNLWRFMNATFAGTAWHPSGCGSNSWVVASTRSAGGSPILCNDPHLRLTLPSIWYLMHLRAERNSSRDDSFEAWGASIPGSPCIHIGHNRWIGWGITAALCDDVDLYREKLHPVEPERYLHGHEWLKIISRREIIRIRGQVAMTKNVRATRHGPIISDFDDDRGSREALSLRWTAHDPSQEFCSLYGVNRAHNWDEFLVALSHQAAPALNYLYADQQGNIGYSLAGKIPVRSQSPSLLPLEGWSLCDEWQGYIPFEELPRLYNPPEGIIATANNKPVDDAYRHTISGFFEPPYRIQRIRSLLAENNTWSVDDMAKIQMDVVSLHAKTVLDHLRADLSQLSADDSKTKTAADRLLKWNGRCHGESVEATIYHVFYHRLVVNLLMPVLGEELFSGYTEIFNQSLIPVDRILENPNSVWFTDCSRLKLVAKSLEQAVDELTHTLGSDLRRWRWGRIHTLSLIHNLGRVACLRPCLSLGPFPSFGDNTTVNLGFYRHSDPYRHTVGASLRAVIDFSDWRNSGFVLPSGQSGHPFSPHYGDQATLWRDGLRVDISSSTPADRCLVLTPEQRGANDRTKPIR
jgi:penicillin amidase